MATLAAPAPRTRPGRLLRVLGLVFGVAVGVGSMIGGGILRAPGSVLEQVPYAGIALLIWAVAGLHALLSANVVAEVMTAVPKSGGLFVPARAAFGRSAGLLIGWTDWLGNVAAIAALSIACGEFAAIIVPALEGSQGLVGVGIALGLFLLNWLGVREGSSAQIVGSALKGIFLLGVAGAVFLLPGGQGPADPTPAALVQPLSLWGLIVAYQLIVGVYSGWPNPSYFSEEDTDPARNIPRALFSSILAVTAIYVLINAALLYAVPVSSLRTSELPVALAISNIFGPLSLKIVAGAAIVTIASCLNAMMMVAPRILHGLAREGLFPAAAERVNKGGTPSVALAVTAVFSLLLTLTGQFETIFLIMGAVGMLPLIVAELAFFKLRRSAPDLHRPYRAIAYPWLPALVLAIDGTLLGLFLLADLRSGLGIVLAVAVCVPIGWAMGRRAADPDVPPRPEDPAPT